MHMHVFTDALTRQIAPGPNDSSDAMYNDCIAKNLGDSLRFDIQICKWIPVSHAFERLYTSVRYNDSTFSQVSCCMQEEIHLQVHMPVLLEGLGII